MIGLLQDLVAIHREIYLAFADRIGDFAKTGDWTLLAAYLPMGILFGALHARPVGDFALTEPDLAPKAAS